MSISKNFIFTLSLCALSAQADATRSSVPSTNKSDLVVRKLVFSTPEKENPTDSLDHQSQEAEAYSPSGQLFSPFGFEDDKSPPDSPYLGTKTQSKMLQGKELNFLDLEDAQAQEIVRSIFDITKEEVETELLTALQFLYDAPQHTFYDPITAKLIKGAIFQSTPNGDCGYTSMFLERASAIDNTLEMSSNMLVRSLVHKNYVGDKEEFEAYVSDARDDKSNYLRLETNVRYNRNATVNRLTRLGIPVQNDLIAGVAFTNNRHVVGLLHESEEDSDVSLFPCYISKNIMNPGSRLVYILFEGEGEHGVKGGIHYNIVMPTERPDSISEEQYNENVVIAYRCHIAALAYMKEMEENIHAQENLLLMQYKEEDELVRAQFEKEKKPKSLSPKASSLKEAQIQKLKESGFTDQEIEDIMNAVSSIRKNPVTPTISTKTAPKKAPLPNSSKKTPEEKDPL